MVGQMVAFAVAALLLTITAYGRNGVADTPSAALAASIEERLSHDPIAPLDDVDVTVTGGYVLLRGTAPSLLARERAARIARSVESVAEIKNEIALRPRVQLSAAELRGVVATALLMTPATQSHPIEVTARQDGAVALNGTVASWAERAAAEHVAKSIGGVTAVHNEIEVEYATQRPDAEISADIQRLLRWDAYLGDDDIHVSVRDGTVSLTGTVQSSGEKSHAGRLAWIAGTKNVEVEGLKVAAGDDPPFRAHRQREVGTSDQDIAAAVRSRIELSASVPSLVDVRVEQGTATLRGEVGTLAAKRQAAAMASQVTGVERVEDLLRVADPDPVTSDRELSSRITSALESNPITDGYEIEVDVRNGVVDLSGNVSSWIEKGTADDLVAAIRGVRAINNRLQVLDYSRARRTG